MVLTQEHPRSPESGWITLRGVKTHHLKNIDVAFPKNAISIVTGVSGSGKTSLVVDTLLRASQELFLEAMQIDLSQAQRAQLVANLDSIEGVLPCLAGLTPRYERRRGQSVASVAQLLRPLRGLFQSAGVLLCSECGTEAEASRIEDLVDETLSKHLGARLVVLARAKPETLLESLRQAGVLRVELDGQLARLEEVSQDAWEVATRRYLVVDRIRVKPDGAQRLTESLRRAFSESDGVVALRYDDVIVSYSRDPWCPNCEREVATIDATVFDLGNRSSQCETCHGDGVSKTIESNRLIDDSSLSLLEGAIGLLLHRNFRKLETEVLKFCRAQEIAADQPFETLSPAERRKILEGCPEVGFLGVPQLFLRMLNERASTRNEQLLSEVVIEQDCLDCEGTGLSKVLETYRLGDFSLFEWLKRPVADVLDYVCGKLKEEPHFGEHGFLESLRARLTALNDLGLGHLELRRRLDSMSLGEQQRTRLVPLLSSNLSGLLIVFDEPTTSLHRSEIEPLWSRIEELREAGNTVVLIEHNRTLWSRADWLVELGPKGGSFGGELLWNGPPPNDPSGGTKLECVDNIRHVPVSERVLKLRGLSLRNLKDVEIDVPHSALVGISGVSGSGKTTLAIDGLGEELTNSPETFEGDLPEAVRIVRNVTSGHSSSTSATYTGVLEPIRKWYASLPESKLRGYAAGYFSYRRAEGRCEACNGSGIENDELERYRVIMRPCRECDGRRFGHHVEQVRYKGASISDVLRMNARQASELFEKNRPIAGVLEHFIRLGLDYLPLGLSTSALSFGERQRLTLIRALAKSSQQPSLYIFDEPSRGLHDRDIEHLLSGFSSLIEQGHTIVVVEHNELILRECNWHYVLGPGAGAQGGQVVYQGESWAQASAAQP